MKRKSEFHKDFCGRKTIVAAVATIIALSACGGGDYENSVSSAQTGEASSVGTGGGAGGANVTLLSPVFTSKTSSQFPSNTWSIAALKDESYAFVSLSGAIIDGVASSSGAVIAVLKKEAGTWNIVRYIPVNQESKAGTQALGLTLSRDESVLFVALGNYGIGLLDVKEAIAGAAKPVYLDLYSGYNKRNSGPGSLAIVESGDGKHIFIADEYGEFPGGSGIGDVAVVSYEKNGGGNINARRLGYIRPEQNSIAGINASPDNKVLYILSQLSPKNQYQNFRGLSYPEVAKQCGASYSGSISIVDVGNLLSVAESNPGDGNRILDNVIQSKVAAGCNPVRVTASQDGKTVWATARGDNKVNAFDAELLRSDPDRAYLYSFESNGAAPVGIASFAGDGFLAVTNSNRFAAVDKEGNPLKPNISIFDVGTRGAPKLLQQIPSGEFPRDIYRRTDDKSIFVMNWSSGTFQEISVEYR
ncbi:YncE family protein [Burkholderia stagnalis]|uniref:YncE family protein n=1 Tax=Burkholderia stagnalis TaxID=1503054 RepID=UPI000AF5AE98|nr:hypothetical protein [Burkholderia stagnalis]